MDGFCVEFDKLTASHAELWHQLHTESNSLASPFSTLEFCRAVHTAKGGVHVLVLKERGATTGFVPFQHRGRRSYSTTGEKVGGHMSDCFDVIGSTRRTYDWPELLRRMKLDALRVDHAPVELFSADRQNMSEGTGIAVSAGDFSLFLKSLRRTQSKFLNGLDRAGAKLRATHGEISFSWQSNRVDLDLRRLILEKRRQYADSNVPDVFASEWTLNLLTLLTQAPTGKLRAVLSTLHSGSNWLSSCLSLGYGDTLHVWFPAYSPTFRNYSPGHLLFLRLFEEGVRRGYSKFDFGLGAADYKRRYGGYEYPLASGLLTQNTPWGLLERVRQSIEWRIDGLSKHLRHASAWPPKQAAG